MLEAKLEALARAKDDMLTIAEIGVDQVIVDEAQEFRKLTLRHQHDQPQGRASRTARSGPGTCT